MMNRIVALLVVLAGSVIDSADAVSCYQCNYTNSATLGTSTCTEPFNATTTANCSAPMCTWQFTNYTSPMSFSLVYRDCLNDSTVMLTDLCEQYRTKTNYTTFKYGDTCCYTAGPQGDKGTTYSETVCFCQKDNCNGNIPLTMTPSTTTIKSTNAMSLLKSSIGGNWALVVVTIVWMVTKIMSAG